MNEYQVQDGQLIEGSCYPQLPDNEDFSQAMRKAGWSVVEAYPQVERDIYRMQVWAKDGQFILECDIPYDNMVGVLCKNAIELAQAAAQLKPYFELINAIVQFEETTDAQMQRKRHAR